jgi:DNA/RNA endonuclease YhcR with UshA esterase domain
MQKKKLFFVGIILCIVIVAVTGFYWYQKPRAGLADIKPVLTVSAQSLYKAFQQDEIKANEQYVAKVIQVKGIIDNVQATDSSISLLLVSGDPTGGVNCSIIKDETNANLQLTKGKEIQVKGRCIGYLMDVNLVDAVIEQ